MSRVPPSRFFVYRNGGLYCEAIDLRRAAKELGTPAYVYSWNAILDAYRQVDASLSGQPHLICYALKANGNLSILRRLAKLGCGADIVSGGELARALTAGVPPDRIVFSGVGKTNAEIESALAAGIRSIHAESAAEVLAIEAIAKQHGHPAPVSVRVNPDVDPQTHPYIATGLKSSKFGVPIDESRELFARIAASPHLELEGVALHIGSLMGSARALEEAVTAVGRLACDLKAGGAPLRTLDAGGGWPIAYGNEPSPPPPLAIFGQAVRAGLAASGADRLGLELLVEPGRSIVGDAGVLLAEVLFVKEHGGKRFVIVDAAMTELVRPALYQAYHAVMPLQAAVPGAPLEPADVVGPVCETSDFLALERALPPLARGDLLAIRGAGAYAASMASHYNSRPRAIEALVDGDRLTVVRRRERVEDIWRDELLK